MKVSVVISIKNRTKLFRRSLKQYCKQSMLEQDWELVIVDDSSDEDVLGTLQMYAPDLNWQYIKMDSSRNDFPIYWGPSLSNNVGFKSAKGEVIAIAGPEIMVDSNTLDLSYEVASTGVSAFGHVLFSSNQFVQLMDSNPGMEDLDFKDLFALHSAKSGYPDITKDNFYWFWAACPRQAIMDMGGCDEEFMRGIVGDDDDFADRLRLIGATPVHEFRINGIHQEHVTADRADPKRIRRNGTWEAARKINTEHLESNRKNKVVVVNQGRDWGSEKLVINRVINKI